MSASEDEFDDDNGSLKSSANMTQHEVRGDVEMDDSKPAPNGDHDFAIDLAMIDLDDAFGDDGPFSESCDPMEHDPLRSTPHPPRHEDSESIPPRPEVAESDPVRQDSEDGKSVPEVPPTKGRTVDDVMEEHGAPRKSLKYYNHAWAAFNKWRLQHEVSINI